MSSILKKYFSNHNNRSQTLRVLESTMSLHIFAYSKEMEDLNSNLASFSPHLEAVKLKAFDFQLNLLFSLFKVHKNCFKHFLNNKVANNLQQQTNLAQLLWHCMFESNNKHISISYFSNKEISYASNKQYSYRRNHAATQTGDKTLYFEYFTPVTVRVFLLPTG